MHKECLIAIGVGLLAAALTTAQSPVAVPAETAAPPRAHSPVDSSAGSPGLRATDLLDKEVAVYNECLAGVPAPQHPVNLCPPPSHPGDSTPLACPDIPPAPLFDGRNPRVWFTADYLMWWVKGAPVPLPLVTTGSPSDRIPGGIGQPGTSVLLGNQNIDYGNISGLRFDAGWWLDADQRFGVEAVYFTLERRAKSFRAAADGNGNPVLAIPANDVQTPGGPIAEVVAIHDPTFGPLFTGNVAVSTTLRLQGGEINATFNCARESWFHLDVLAGFRSANLTESLVLQTSSTALAPQILSFNGVFFDPPGSVTTLDSFHTSNTFYGGQAGGRFDYYFGDFTLNVTGTLAVGATQSVTTINGFSTFQTPGSPTATAPGGIFALPSNMGRQAHTAFSIIPEVGINLGLQLTPHLLARIGYRVMYWSNVDRPGSQIDRNVNPQSIPTDQGFGQGGGPARPTFIPQQTDFWAQGISAGLELSF